MARYGHIKKGPAADLADGNYYKSGWERDVARLLTLWTSLELIDGFDYEPESFYFTEYGYKRGPYKYTPDFRIRLKDGREVWWEVKGRVESSDRTKWKRFTKHTPHELVVIDRKKMREFRERWAVHIPAWETSS